MGSPANDLFANRVVLSSIIQGSTTGTNKSASAEAGEPTNNGRTVWYEWDAPRTTNVQFSTCYTAPSTTSSLLSVLQYFTGSGAATQSVTSVGEGQYIHPETFKTRNNYWDSGSSIVFFANKNSKYYIRVDGNLQTNQTASQGDFQLNWKEQVHYILGSCSKCPPIYGCGWTCLGSASPNVLNSSSFVSYGTFGSGSYIVSFCKGAFVVDNTTDPGGNSGSSYTVVYGGSTFTSSYYVSYVSGSATQSFFNNLPPFTDNANKLRTYYSEVTAEEAFLNSCTRLPFIHTGGDISVQFFDQGPANNSIGNPNPVWGLYSFTGLPNFDPGQSSACARWVNPGVSSNVTFSLYNNSSYPAIGVTATLITGSGISGVSGPLTNLTFPPFTATPVAFSFNNSTSNLTAVVSLNVPGGTCGTSNLSFYLAPIITVSPPGSVSGPSPRVFCSTDAINGSFIVGNLGNWNIDTQISISFATPIKFFEGQTTVCVSSTLHTQDLGFINCGQTGVTAFAPETTVISPGGGGLNRNVNVQVKDEANENLFSGSFPFFLP